MRFNRATEGAGRTNAGIPIPHPTPNLEPCVLPHSAEGEEQGVAERVQALDQTDLGLNPGSTA